MSYSFLHYLGLYTLELVCFLRVNLLIGVSKSQIEVLRRRYAGPTLVMNNYPSVSEMKYLFHPVEGASLVIGMSGYILRSRGHNEVMDALSLMADKYQIEFRVIGDGPERLALEEKAESMPYQCSFLGYVESRENFWKEISKFDYAIIANHPTLNYSVTSINRPYEYAALGVPFICPHYRGIDDILKELELPNFNPFTPDSIRNALEIVMNKPRSDLAERGRELVENHFCWEVISEDLLEIYTRLDTSFT